MKNDTNDAFFYNYMGGIIIFNILSHEDTEVDLGFSTHLNDTITHGLDCDESTDLLYVLTDSGRLYVVDFPSQTAVVLSSN